MKRTSPYYPLQWRVDCMEPPNPATWWQTICAFNSDSVAIDYAKRCAVGNGQPWRYRVMKRTGKGWSQLWSSEPPADPNGKDGI